MSILKVPINETDHIQGNKNATITLVEYGDYQCPACGLAFPILKKVQKQFSKNLLLVFRHFPLIEIHPYAEVAAETAEFAGQHNKFWEMHDLLYTHQKDLTLPLLFELTQSIGLSETELQFELQNGTFKGKIKSDFLSGVYSGVDSTPTLFINGHKHEGPYDFETLVETIEHQLVPK